jgi:hypothetical protein
VTHAAAEQPPGSRPAAEAADTVSLLGTIDGSTAARLEAEPRPAALNLREADSRLVCSQAGLAGLA